MSTNGFAFSSEANSAAWQNAIASSPRRLLPKKNLGRAWLNDAGKQNARWIQPSGVCSGDVLLIRSPRLLTLWASRLSHSFPRLDSLRISAMVERGVAKIKRPDALLIGAFVLATSYS